MRLKLSLLVCFMMFGVVCQAQSSESRYDPGTYRRYYGGVNVGGIAYSRFDLRGTLIFGDPNYGAFGIEGGVLIGGKMKRDPFTFASIDDPEAWEILEGVRSQYGFNIGITNYGVYDFGIVDARFGNGLFYYHHWYPLRNGDFISRRGFGVNIKGMYNINEQFFVIGNLGPSIENARLISEEGNGNLFDFFIVSVQAQLQIAYRIL